MEIIAIEQRTFEELKLRLEQFAKEVRELCNDGRTNTEWFDNQDVCLILQISKRTLQSYRDNGTLSFSQLGHKCYYKKTDIEKLVETSSIKSNNHGDKR